MNKVKFNIKNLHYAPMTEEGTYGTPVAIPGAVSISLEPQGEISSFYADGIQYYTASTNGGYEGDVEVALIPDSFRKDILKEIEDTNKVLIENADEEPEKFALGMDIDGDSKTTKFWFYNCVVTRATVKSQTNEKTKTPITDTFTVSCTPGSDGSVRAKTTNETPEEVLGNWYKSVYKAVVG